MISTLKSSHDLADLLRAAGLAKSTYYYHAARAGLPDKHAALKAEIRRLFELHKSRFGYRRIWLLLRREGQLVTKKLVLKLMQHMGLRSKVRIKRKYNSYRGSTSHIAENHLARDFVADTPNRKWVSDVTEFRVANQKVYLSPVYDLYDHTVVSYRAGISPNTVLTSESLQAAFEHERPAECVLVHTDQGFQYQHSSWQTILTSHYATQSMSRKGNCYDNAVMENFFGHLKAEMYHGEHFDTVEDLLTEIDDYMHWYNTERVQERLKGMTPMEYRNHALQMKPA